jgi:hypothetical protein
MVVLYDSGLRPLGPAVKGHRFVDESLRTNPHWSTHDGQRPPQSATNRSLKHVGKCKVLDWTGPPLCPVDVVDHTAKYREKRDLECINFTMGKGKATIHGCFIGGTRPKGFDKEGLVCLGFGCAISSPRAALDLLVLFRVFLFV